ARNAATHLPLRRRRVAPVPAQVRMRDHHAAATRAPGFAADLRQELDAHLLGAAPEPGVARKATRIAVAEAKRDRALPAEVLEPRRSPAGPQAVALVQPLRPLDARRAQHRQLVGGQRNRTAIGPAREEGLVEAH